MHNITYSWIVLDTVSIYVIVEEKIFNSSQGYYSLKIQQIFSYKTVISHGTYSANLSCCSI